MPLRNRKQSANIHDKRHENGLAQPAVRKSSKSKLDTLAAVDVPAGLSAQTLARSTDAPDTDDFDQHSFACTGADGTSTTNPMVASSKSSSEGGSDGGTWDASADATADEQEPVAAPSKLALNGAASRQDASSSASLLDSNTTIITPQPLRDVVAVLLLLLQLPPHLLTIIQLAYAFIGTPPTTFSFTFRLYWHDWFHGHGGNPSLITMITTDLIFMLVWFMLTSLLPALRDVTLDLAQTVIAMSLGGGTVAKGGWTYSLACLSIVTSPHLLRSKTWSHYAAAPLHSAVNKTNAGFITNVPVFVSAKYTHHSWLRMILELHILAQGAVRVIRHWIDRQPGTASVRRIDPEAANLFPNLPHATSIDSSGEGARNGSSDGRSPGPSPAVRESKEKNVSSGKKRRKQGNFVRSQQPFWAAIASTKITVTRDLESTQASKDAKDAVAAEALRQGQDDVKHNSVEDQVWISFVDQTEVFFVAVTATPGHGGAQNGGLVPANGALCIRVNGARWSHFEYKSNDEMIAESTKKRAVKGRIYGLTPGESLYIEFIDRAEVKVIYSAHLVTRPLSSSDATATTAAAPPPPPPDSLRPSSPATTLKKAIAAAEHQLTEFRTRSKKSRKDHKSSITGLKKEVDALENRLSSSNGMDERQRQRQAQFRQNIKQAEEAVILINQQIDELSEIPQNEKWAHETAALAWEDELKRRTAAREELERTKADGERQMAALKAEHANIRQKIEKGETKLVNQEQKRANLQFSTTQARRAKSRWDAQRAATLATWHGKERELHGAIQYLESQRQEIENRTAQLLQQQNYFHDHSLAQSSNGPSTVQHTPEASFVALANNSRPPAFSNLQYPHGNASVHTRENSLRQQPRGRSSSMLSAISGFTEDDTPASSAFADFSASGQAMARNGSAGSANGSAPEATYPTPKMSPIGTGRGSPRVAYASARSTIA